MSLCSYLIYFQYSCRNYFYWHSPCSLSSLCQRKHKWVGHVFLRHDVTEGRMREKQGRSQMLHDVANDDGYAALKWAAEDREGWRHREGMSQTAVQQKTTELNCLLSIWQNLLRKNHQNCSMFAVLCSAVTCTLAWIMVRVIWFSVYFWAYSCIFH